MKRKRIPFTYCPHCKASAYVRGSEPLTTTVREARMVCTNDDCGHIFIAQITIVRTLLPSMAPDPTVSIPLGQRALRRQPPPGNDNHPAPANDDSDHPAAAHLTEQ